MVALTHYDGHIPYRQGWLLFFLRRFALGALCSNPTPSNTSIFCDTIAPFSLCTTIRIRATFVVVHDDQIVSPYSIPLLGACVRCPFGPNTNGDLLSKQSPRTHIHTSIRRVEVSTRGERKEQGAYKHPRLDGRITVAISPCT